VPQPSSDRGLVVVVVIVIIIVLAGFRFRRQPVESAECPQLTGLAQPAAFVAALAAATAAVGADPAACRQSCVALAVSGGDCRSCEWLLGVGVGDGDGECGCERRGNENEPDVSGL